jgi:predicted AAA+ superfamily ATPase
LFPRLRGAIDQDRRKTGRFLLLGSVAPSLMREISESLAGRLALLELTPLLLPELTASEPPPSPPSSPSPSSSPSPHQQEATIDRLWFHGGYPDGGILSPDTQEPVDTAPAFGQWQRDYLSLLAQRDLPSWGLPAKPQVTDRLLRLVAAFHGQQWNASQVGQNLSLTYQTVNSYMDYLEGAFLVRCLRPWQANVGKRLVRRPKYYWRDSGLLHALLGIDTPARLLAQPWCGASWEGFVIEQALGVLKATGHAPDPWFFRTSDGHEIDLLVDVAGERWAIEIKLGSAPSTRDLAKLRAAADMVDATKRVLVSRKTETVEAGNTLLCSLPVLLDKLGGG